jgi:hypothetical protein
MTLTEAYTFGYNCHRMGFVETPPDYLTPEETIKWKKGWDYWPVVKPLLADLPFPYLIHDLIDKAFTHPNESVLYALHNFVEVARDNLPK